MHWMHKKLNSKSGISLAIALVFFLLCAMVGTVVLSAASVSAGNTARERQLYRETLALTSAANLLSQDIQGMTQDIQGMTFIGTYKWIETVTTIPPVPGSGELTRVETEVKFEPGKYVDETANTAPKLENSKLFRMEAADTVTRDDLNLWSIYDYNQKLYFEKKKDPNNLNVPSVTQVKPVSKNITFGPVEEKNIPQVTGTVTVEPDYTITVVLSSGNDTLTMSFPPKETVKITVGDPTVDLNGTKTTVTTYTTTLTWGQPTIREGGKIDAPETTP